MIQKKRIAILGSTGSIGTQALEVVRSHREAFEVTVLVARRSTELLIAQALEFSPAVVVISDEAYYPEVRQALSHTSIEVMAGSEAIAEVVVRPDVDIVLTAMVGFSGLVPTLAAITAGKTIALSNKETLVVAGELDYVTRCSFMERVYLPVDSEHSAIYQCLVGEEGNPLERILLTASGGPFRSYKRVEELETVTVEAALRHPNWSMGAKVTIDSASLMNKGLEMIEARWLFDTPAESIEVLVHPQSIIHSMVEFADGSIKAQLGQPDMRLPISYALGLTERVSNDYPRLNFLEHTFTFERPNMELFPNLALAYRALELGGTAPCVLNAANEIAVEAFLAGKLGFRAMSTLIAQTLEAYRPERSYDLQLLSELDATVRAESRERLNHIR